MTEQVSMIFIQTVGSNQHSNETMEGNVQCLKKQAENVVHKIAEMIFTEFIVLPRFKLSKNGTIFIKIKVIVGNRGKGEHGVWITINSMWERWRATAIGEPGPWEACQAPSCSEVCKTLFTHFTLQTEECLYNITCDRCV